MERLEELKILIKDIKWWIDHYASELKTSSTDKYLILLKDKINQLDNYLKEEKQLNKK